MNDTNTLTRRDFLKVGAAAFTTALLPNLNTKAASGYNVLFIVVDDLRPMLGCYGYSEIHTPNIDAIAARGTLFNRAYCQFPVCNPSRVSMLTGIRPKTTGFINNPQIFREVLPHVVTLPQHFKAHGYHTRAVGKVTHGPSAYPYSWSIPEWSPRYRPPNGKPVWQALDVGDDELRDGEVAKQTVKTLTEIQDLQFFLAVGFYKPHLPYHAPRKYFNLYDLQMFEALPDILLPSTHEIRDYSGVPAVGEPFSEEQTVALMRGYAAATSYVDAQVGRVLHQLDALGLTDSTIIVFCSDHGFHLGEHGWWGKHTLFEVSLHSPVIVSLPNQSQGTKTDAIVELVDIFPTLCDACEQPLRPELEGISMVPVIQNPTRPWKTAAFSQYGKHRFSIRTARYRYTEWGSNGRRGKELYDYQTDPHETVNIAHLPENAALVAHLSERLHDGWERALPGTQEHVPVPQTLPEDVNNDGVVDIRDLVRVSNRFGESGGTAIPEDVNNDGVVNIRDLVRVANQIGKQ